MVFLKSPGYFGVFEELFLRNRESEFLEIFIMNKLKSTLKYVYALLLY